MIDHAHYSNSGLVIESMVDHITIHAPWFEHSSDIIQCELNTKIEIESIRTYIKILNNGYFQTPTTDEVAEKLDQIIQYIDGININSVFNSYHVEKSGQYVRRVGRDDHYHYQIYKKLDTSDEYLRSLFDLKDEDDYYACNTQGEDEVNMKNEPQYNKIKWAIADAERKYTRTRHIAYYIQKLFVDFEKRETRFSNLKKSLQKRFCQKQVSKLFSEVVQQRYFGYGINLDEVNDYIQQRYIIKRNSKE